MNKEELEEYKHRCIFALTVLSYDDNAHFIESARDEIVMLERIINECFELKEKATPKKKKINYSLGISRCPTCGKDTYNEWYKYCPNCGQRIEGEEDE